MNLADNYRRDGFVVLKDAFQPGWDSSAMERRCRDWQKLPREEYLRAARLFAKGLSQTAIFLVPNIQKAAMQLGIKDPVFLTNPTVHVMGVDEKWEGTAAHQDWPAMQGGLNSVVVWIPFTDVGLDNYPLEFAAGSHLCGLLPAKAGAHYSEVETDGMEFTEFTPVQVRVGEAILFSVFTVHRTRTPGTGFRIGMSHRYEDAADKWFIEHQGYSAQSRVIEREVKEAPSAERVREVFA